MNIDNIDTKVVAAVLRRQQEIGREHASLGMSERLKAQRVPDFLLKRVLDYTNELVKGSSEKLEVIISAFENKEVNFTDTTLRIMNLSLDLTVESSTKINEIIHAAIVSGELEEYFAEEEVIEEVTDGESN